MAGKLTYSRVVSTMALFIALGTDGAYAAAELGKNQVKAKRIKVGYDNRDLGRSTHLRHPPTPRPLELATGGSASRHTCSGANGSTAACGRRSAPATPPTHRSLVAGEVSSSQEARWTS